MHVVITTAEYDWPRAFAFNNVISIRIQVPPASSSHPLPQDQSILATAESVEYAHERGGRMAPPRSINPLGATTPTDGKRKRLALRITAPKVQMTIAAIAIAPIEATQAYAGDDDDAHFLLSAIDLARGGYVQRDEGSSAFIWLAIHRDGGWLCGPKAKRTSRVNGGGGGKRGLNASPPAGTVVEGGRSEERGAQGRRGSVDGALAPSRSVLMVPS